MLKRLFDILFSIIGLLFLSWIIIIFVCIATIDTQSFGIFCQKRVGQYGKLFIIYKIKTIEAKTGKISKIGQFLRKSKIDEFPQLWNILIGNMSFVGPRPDIEGYYDKLEGEYRNILKLKPGLTSEASIKYANEEEILSFVDNPLTYNDEIIFKDKIKMNLEYYNCRTFLLDLHIIYKTLFRTI
ncbi:LPS biosynthesis sugar transferase [Flavobacterium branchiophilum NBRC 15030 = ATCC 35035]|uniref:Lipopolysaccharide/colanic/teichoic acid biosynthesis glycosyltransferase n=1 Tax=Flavobacterium branchiophilum TaxID=55197 RepID=A0A543G7N2_9FLAO|nr:sugar transferase [Flavobacterium branchiophilum]OXA76009.1 LPS biosynthesis sugar transferase [Flavobacterium branchiophilum NBRC 15030 = ATCC 35035]TQM42093.1 lipopolysaccharide/colanic/teichoic acid biosynthesis glycosyltransferase [Flavobacterium branchiophilum]GEM53866.1 glycosyl transferase [Flavobacterium branchiophilum NBRC 15030 = ATCC 35035]